MQAPRRHYSAAVRPRLRSAPALVLYFVATAASKKPARFTRLTRFYRHRRHLAHIQLFILLDY
jgi:hypothetical protein